VPGSRKGEHRGNAKKRTVDDRTSLSPKTPHELMTDAVQREGKGRGKRGIDKSTIDRQIQIHRTIHGTSGSVLDMTPREVMLAAMHHNMQVAVDWKAELVKLVQEPEPDQAVLNEVEANVSLHLDKAAAHAAQVAPFIHPRFSAIAHLGDGDEKPESVLQKLLDEVDNLQRSEPMLIEHVPKQRTA
jgi:hypothetical protein